MDYVRDNNPRPLYLVDQVVGIPAFVKEAGVITDETTNPLADVAFADPVRREFPCFDKVSTYLSFAYFAGSGRESPEIEARIVKAAEVFGLKAEVDQIRSALAQTKSASAPERKFALPAGSVEGISVSLYPINDREEIEGSAHQLGHDRSRMPVAVFRKAAQAIVQAADRCASPCTLLESVKRAGEARIPNRQLAQRILALRKSVVKTAEHAALYDDLVQGATSCATDEEMEKFAALCAELDQICGVRYENGIVDPWSALFCGETVAEIEKAAAELVFVGDAPVPRSVLQGIPEDKLAQHFSKATKDNILTWRKQAAAEASAGIATLEPAAQQVLLKLALAA